ncbi:MAG: ribosomal protein S18-alanine N-acetyltransferase [Methanomassiliicoccales archaeon]|nr:ribosomal protein S18-alanine N-acetyltransferase [Methanomassiliicoccales archaeon]NYT15113.1 ribosomal protein S18-alanine N-acetyltransferase [Methanomassiliicoccales archaeon]
MVDIRKADPADLAGIEQVEVASFESNRFERGVLILLLTEDKFHNWVAEEDDEILGYASIMRQDNDNARLLSIAVIPESRNQGVGKSLMGAVRRHVKESGGDRVSLEVRVSNVPAINLYLSEGFKVKGLLKDYYSKGRKGPEDALFMILDVTSEE